MVYLKESMKRLIQENKKLTDVGILILRVGLGAIFIWHGYPKLMGGYDKWLWLGSQMQNFGITFAPIAWGVAAACAEFFGGIALIIGLFTRVAAFFIANVMIVAIMMHHSLGQGFDVINHPTGFLIVMISLIFMGGGRYSLDNRLN